MVQKPVTVRMRSDSDSAMGIEKALLEMFS